MSQLQDNNNYYEVVFTKKYLTYERLHLSLRVMKQSETFSGYFAKKTAVKLSSIKAPIYVIEKVRYLVTNSKKLQNLLTVKANTVSKTVLSEITK